MLTEEVIPPAEGVTPPPAAAALPAATFTWDQIKASLPEELRADKSMEVITSVEGLTKSYINGQKAIGIDKISIPDKHATPEDWKNIYKKLGNPEKIEDYKYNLEGESAINMDLMDKIKAVAHESGVLPWQFEKMINAFNAEGKTMLETSNTLSEGAHIEEVNKLKAEWGANYDSQLRKASIALKEFIPDAVERKAFLESGLSSDPRVVKVLANAAKLMSEDTFAGHGSGEFGGLSKADALKKATDIQSNFEHAYHQKGHPSHIAAKAEVASLYQIAYPE